MTMNTSSKTLRMAFAALALLFAFSFAGAQNAGRPPVPPQGAGRPQAQSQDADKASVRTDYIDADKMPDASVFLPAPPKPGDPLFDSDLVYYEWGKTIRPTERGQRAHDDAKSSLDYLAQALEPAVGVRISNEQTPNLYRLLSKSMTSPSITSEHRSSAAHGGCVATIMMRNADTARAASSSASTTRPTSRPPAPPPQVPSRSFTLTRSSRRI